MSETAYRVLIETELYESTESLSNPIGLIPQDTSVTLVEPNVGKHFQLSKIEYMVAHATSTVPAQYAEVFIRSCFLTPDTDAGNTDPTDTYQITGEEKPEQVPNPVKMKDAKPSMPYDEGDSINIVLDSRYVDKQEIEDNLNDLKLTAISRMVEYYGKKENETLMNEFVLNPFGLIKVHDYYFPSRPCKGILVKFSIRKKYFDAFEDMSFDDFSIENIHKNFIATSIMGKEFEKTMRDVVKVLEKYSLDVNKFGGSLVGIDFGNSSNEMRNFISSFKKFLSANNVSLANIGESKFELGFNMETYRLEYVLHFDPYGNFLTVGLKDMSLNMSPLLSKIIIGYKDMISASMGGMGWMDLCSNYLAGEFKIDFTSPSQKKPSSKPAKSQLEADMKKVSADYDDLTIMDSDKNNQLTNLKKDPQFKAKASELLLRSRDVVGDNFLANLPEILANVEDLNSLYGLVFDKVSIKDLVDHLMETMTENLNLPDINEIKLRGVMKALTPDMALGLVDEFITTDAELNKFSLNICDNLEISADNIDELLSSFTSIDTPIQFYLIHYDTSGNLAGMLVDKYQGDLISKLAEKGINDCVSLLTAYQNNNFHISDYFQSEAIRQIVCDILTTGLPPTTTACIDPDVSVSTTLPEVSITSPTYGSGFKLDIMDLFKTIDPSILLKGIDGFIKDMFSDAKNYQKQLSIESNQTSYVASASPDFSGIEFNISPGDLFDRFAKIPKIKLELDKLSLTKGKMLNKVPNVNLDLESKKKDVSFSLPSIKSVNPSFDFSSFEFNSIGDIFGTAVESIENAIVDGIEKGLVNAFKGILQNVLDSLNMDMPDIDSPDFGGLNMNDLLNASDGASAESVAGLIMDDLSFEIGKFNANFDPNALDISGLVPSLDGIMGILDDMSHTLKPLELTRVMKGQVNKKDFENMTCGIKDPALKQAFTPAVFTRAMGIVADFADVAMLEELEKAYDNKEVMVSVCKNNGIPYCLRDIKDTLEEKYSSFTDDEICELIDDIVEETKDSLVDAIGNMKDNFDDNLPFNQDPCSFMPKPADIPAMDFVNNLAFDAIFDPIELEYKAEATAFPDLMLMTTGSEEYVKVRLRQYDSVPSEVFQDPDTGLFDIEFDFVSNLIDDFDYDNGVFNQDFQNHYFGDQTPIYYLNNAKQFIQADKSQYNITKSNDEYLIEKNTTTSLDDNLYVRKVQESLQPIPRLQKNYLNTGYTIYGYGSNDSLFGIPPSSSPATDADDRTLDLNRGYRIKFKNLSAAESLISFDPPNPTDTADMVGQLVANSTLTDRYPEINFDVNQIIGTTMRFPSVDAISNPQCVEIDHTAKMDTPNLTQNYASSIRESIDYTVAKIFNDIGILSEHDHVPGNYRNFMGFNADGHDTLQQKGEPESREQYDLIANLTADSIQLIMNSMGDSPLFDTNEMLSFLFETEDVNLFKVQQAKNAAKDDYNEDCEFKDDNKSKLKSSSTKQLIYLTMRIYTIDVVMRSCFVNSVVYEEAISDYMINFIYNYMTIELSRQEESYFSVFKDLYAQEYGEEFDGYTGSDGMPEPPPKFKQTITEIYNDMLLSFETIFPDAAKGVVGAALDKIEIFAGTNEEFISKLYDTYMLGKQYPNEHSRFIIQLIVVNSSDGSEELFTSQTNFLGNVPLKIRLCYIMDEYETCPDLHSTLVDLSQDSTFEYAVPTSPHGFSPYNMFLAYADNYYSEDGYSPDDNWLGLSYIGSDDDDMNSGVDDADMSVLGTFRENYRNPSVKTYFPVKVEKFPKTMSFNMHYFDDAKAWANMADGTNPRLIVLPLAETHITTTSETYTSFKSRGHRLFFGTQEDVLWQIDGRPLGRKEVIRRSVIRYITESVADAEGSHPHAEEFTIYDFLKNRMRLDSYLDLIRRTLLVKLQQIKPEVMFAFADTKDAIRRAIMSMSKEKEVFDYIELETDTTQKEQSQGVGTSPDFSPKAKKMALMTVPLIVKGMAEMFDPNTKVASLIRKTAEISGLNIPPTIASLMALPFNVIPLAPGPPITPLGLTYLATSFLEPKERKKLSDLKRGKNINPGADPETGGFVGGSPEELLEARQEAAREAYRLSNDLHMKMISFCKSWSVEFVSIMYEICGDDWDDFPDYDSAVNMEFPEYKKDGYHIPPEGYWGGSNYASAQRVVLHKRHLDDEGDTHALNTSFRQLFQTLLTVWTKVGGNAHEWTYLHTDAGTTEYPREDLEARFMDFMNALENLIRAHSSTASHHIDSYMNATANSTIVRESGAAGLLNKLLERLSYIPTLENQYSSTESGDDLEAYISDLSKFGWGKEATSGMIKANYVMVRAFAFLGYGILRILNDAGLSPDIDFSTSLTDDSRNAWEWEQEYLPHSALAEHEPGTAILNYNNSDWDFKNPRKDSGSDTLSRYWNSYVANKMEPYELIFPSLDDLFRRWYYDAATYTNTFADAAGYLEEKAENDDKPLYGRLTDASDAVRQLYREQQLFFYYVHNVSGLPLAEWHYQSPKGAAFLKLFTTMAGRGGAGEGVSSLYDMLVTFFMEAAEDGGDESRTMSVESQDYDGSSLVDMESPADVAAHSAQSQAFEDSED